ncbi:MAG TPA: protease pro-enzyme activation domain-containing protein [Candidatus Acidoferrales bacterium]|nr:protease pro-enzyme activation domain-containing protein [Candidatus Acidoferrales bacterium]
MNRFTMRAAGGALSLAIALAACGGGGGGGLPAQTSVAQPASTPYNGQEALANFSWGASLLQQLHYVGPVTPANRLLLSVNVEVTMQNAAGLVQYAAAANNPRSGQYRHWLTPQQIGTTYGATASNYTQVANYFSQNGLHVAGWPQRETLKVTGPLQAFQKAFGTSFGLYDYHGKNIIAPVGTPHFSTVLPVSGVYGLVAATTMHSFLIKNNNATYYGYAPQQIATGFDYSGAWNAGFTGTGINVGIIGTGPILNASNTDADTVALGSYWGAKMGTVTQVAVSPQPASSANGNTGTSSFDPFDVFLTTPPAVQPNCSNTNVSVLDCNPEDGEAQLDTESIAGLAPGATTLFYLGYEAACYSLSTSEYYDPPCNSGDYFEYAEGIDLTDDELQQAIADNRADAISMSFGEPENIAAYYDYISSDPSAPGLGQIEMASLVDEGIALFASSGDDGAWECQDPSTGEWLGTACVNYPASDPNVVGVGGVNIPLDQSGNLTGAITAWADNTTQGGDGSFGNNVGSGGGVSSVFTPQPWQAATTGVAMREIPDISLDADPLTGPSILQYAGYSGYTQVYAEGGTSAAAPEAAAQWGLVLQACKASSTCNTGGTYGYRLGNPARYYYAIYGSNNALATGSYSGVSVGLGYANVFYDVIYGDNQAVPASSPAPIPAETPIGYNAGPGYDQVTGIGAAFTGHLIQAVTGTQVP